MRFALHVLSTKRITDWRELDKLQATSWLKRWLGERGYSVLWDKLFELEVLRAPAPGFGGMDRHAHQARRAVAAQPLPGRDGLPRRRLAGAAGRVRAASCSAAGADIRLATPVRRSRDRGGARNRCRCHCGGFDARRRRAVHRAAEIRASHWCPTLRGRPSAHRRVENIGVACVLLKLHKPATSYFWMNVNDERIAGSGLHRVLQPEPAAAIGRLRAVYMPKTHPKWAWDDGRLMDEASRYFLMTQPHLKPDDVLARHVSRYEFAQAVCPPGFYDMLPAMDTSIRGFYMADTSYYYPEDRSINESIVTGRKLAEGLLADAAGRARPDSDTPTRSLLPGSALLPNYRARAQPFLRRPHDGTACGSSSHVEPGPIASCERTRYVGQSGRAPAFAYFDSRNTQAFSSIELIIANTLYWGM